MEGGSPAFDKHMKAFSGTPLGSEIAKSGHSLPVHPTQLYESLVGLLLLVLLLWQRKHQKFRGQIFFLFAFAYGYLRFLLEMIRDDTERGEFGPSMPEHWFIALSLFAFALAWAFGMSLGITNMRVRTASRVAAFIPPIVAFLWLKPASFGKETSLQLSTSQWVGLLSALVCSYFYAKAWEQARKSPKLAMSLESLGDVKPPKPDELAQRPTREDDEEAEEEEEEAPKKKKKGKKKREAGVDEERTPLPVKKEEAEKLEEDEDEPEEAPAAEKKEDETKKEEKKPETEKEPA